MVLGIGRHDYFPKEYYNSASDNYWEDKAGWVVPLYGSDPDYTVLGENGTEAGNAYRPHVILNKSVANVAVRRDRILGLGRNLYLVPIPIFF